MGMIIVQLLKLEENKAFVCLGMVFPHRKTPVFESFLKMFQA